MADVCIHHVYDCDEETYWRDILFDPDFNKRLYLEHLGFKQWQVEEHDETAGEIRRCVLVNPKTDELPRAIAKVVGDNLAYREKGVFDKKTGKYRLTVVPAGPMAGKVQVSSVIHCEPRGDGKCERFANMTIKAKIFAVGGLIEKRIIGDTRKSYDKGHAFAQTFLAQRG